MKSFWIASLFAALALPASAAAPAPFSAQYEVIRNGDRLGEATIRFTALGGGRYQLQTNTTGTEGLAALTGAAVQERSILSWRGDQPETVSYDYVQKIGWKTRERHLRVNSENQSIDSQDKDQEYSPPYRSGVLDRHAITVALMQDVAAGKTGDRSYLVPDKDALSPWLFRIDAAAPMQTALGSLRAQRVERIRSDGSGRKTTLWLQADHGFIPLRILQSEANGETIEMRIVSLR
jgi:hypothetical protein